MSEYILEAKNRGIAILGPSVNNSLYNFTVEKIGVRYPLTAIEKIGYQNAKLLIDERNVNGKYTSYYNFVVRCVLLKISKSIIENLIDAGALDEFGYSRLSYKASLEDALRYADIVKVEVADQTSLNLDIVSEPNMTILKDKYLKNCENEKRVFGFYLSDHPIQNVRRKLNTSAIIQIQKGQQKIALVAQINRIKEIKTKNNDSMAFVAVSDDTSSIDLAIMPNLYDKVKSDLKLGQYVWVQGESNRENSVLAKQIVVIDLDSYN